MGKTEKEREIAWENAARGRGNRWRMLRDIVAVLSVQWMNLTILQDTLMRLRGLSRPKVVQMLEELGRSGDVNPVSGPLSGVTVMGYSSSEIGVRSWLGSRQDIPASIVQAAVRSKPVLK